MSKMTGQGFFCVFGSVPLADLQILHKKFKKIYFFQYRE